MAKTTSEIVKENMEKQKIVDQLVSAMKARDERDNKAKESTEETSSSFDDLPNFLERKKILDEIKYPGSVVIQKETTDTVEVVQTVIDEPVQESNISPVTSGTVGFILGAVLMAVYFKLKIKRIQKDCETRISEARTTLDRVLEMATK